MSRPLDQVIVSQLAALLARISTRNGFNTDAGEFVLTEQTRDDLPEDAMTLSIIDDTESLDGDGQRYQRRRGVLNVKVEGSLPVAISDGDQAQFQPVREQARLLMADIRRAVAGQSLTDFGVGITGIRITGRSLPELQDGASYQFCTVSFAFDFTESHLPKE